MVIYGDVNCLNNTFYWFIWLDQQIVGLTIDIADKSRTSPFQYDSLQKAFIELIMKRLVNSARGMLFI